MPRDDQSNMEHTKAGSERDVFGGEFDRYHVPFRFYSAQSLFLAFMTLRHQYQGRDLMKDDLSQNDPIYAVCRQIIKDLDRAYRGRKLLIDHIRILNFYGKRGRAPRDWVPKELSACGLWTEALALMSPIWLKAGYLVEPHSDGLSGQSMSDRVI